MTTLPKTRRMEKRNLIKPTGKARFNPRTHPGAPHITPQTHQRCARPGCTGNAKKPFVFCWTHSQMLPFELRKRCNEAASDVSFRAINNPEIQAQKERVLKDCVFECNEYFRREAAERIEEGRGRQ